MPGHDYDAVVVGSGPNGLAAAITLAQAGCSVLVVEAKDHLGGGAHTEELTLPGFRHDTCSAIHPMGLASPFLLSLPLDTHGLEWVHPEVALAHPLDDGTAVTLDASVERMPAGWRRVFEPLVKHWPMLASDVLRPALRVPTAPITYARFSAAAGLPAVSLGRLMGDDRVQALWAGIAAHAITSLRAPLSSAPGLVMATAGHVGGWPASRGGSGAIAAAMVAHLEDLGGRVETGRPVHSLDDVPRARAIVFDTTPSQLVRIAGDRLPPGSYRSYRHGSAAFKLDYALDGPMPWIADDARRAGTVHLGGTAREVANAEGDVAKGRVPERPLVLVAQQSIFDDTRAPHGKHTLWSYCHLPPGSTEDMVARIESQFDRFAPGWRDLVLARHVMNPAALEARNANYIGGDIAAGSTKQLQLVFRPNISLDPYRSPAGDLYLCSAATPPGAGVHGMCGFHAARSVLRHL